MSVCCSDPELIGRARLEVKDVAGQLLARKTKVKVRVRGKGQRVKDIG